MTSFSDIVTAVRSVASQVAVGGDLTHVSLPAVFCLPRSTIKMLAEKRFSGSELLPKIPECESQLGRMLLVIQWVLSACLVEEQFGKKPLNPILGETYLCKCGDMVYLGEQVSHHPPISAFRFEHLKKDIAFEGTANIKATFFGNSVGVEVKGAAKLSFDVSGRKPDKSHLAGVPGNADSNEQMSGDPDIAPEMEVYVFDPPVPKGYAKGLLIGTQRYELGGVTKVVCEKTGLQCEMEFKLTTIFSSKALNRVSGKIVNQKTGEVEVTFSGRWDGTIELKGKTSEAKELLKKNFSNGILHDFHSVPQCPALEELSTEDSLETTSSVVWKEVEKYIKETNFPEAEKEKIQVEIAQRAYVEELKSGKRDHTHQFFEADETFGFLHNPQTQSPFSGTMITL